MFVHEQEAEDEDSGSVPAGARVPHTNEGINERRLTGKKNKRIKSKQLEAFLSKTRELTFPSPTNHL